MSGVRETYSVTSLGLAVSRACCRNVHGRKIGRGPLGLRVETEVLPSKVVGEGGFEAERGRPLQEPQDG